jgi:hypothetical protein
MRPFLSLINEMFQPGFRPPNVSFKEVKSRFNLLIDHSAPDFLQKAARINTKYDSYFPIK